MMTDLVAIVSLSVLVAGWFLLSRWIAHTDPELPGINRRCGGCGGGGEHGAARDGAAGKERAPCRRDCPRAQQQARRTR